MTRFFSLFFVSLFILSVIAFAGIVMENPPSWVFSVTKFVFSLKD